jgi:hypothetical protein
LPNQPASLPASQARQERKEREPAAERALTGARLLLRRYNKFLNEHEAKLKSMPVPDIARQYYVEDNPYLFDKFCTVKDKDDDGGFSARRPKLETLYDVFVNVRDDEKEHWKTLCNLVQYNDMQGVENKMVQGTRARPAELSQAA